MSDVIFDGLCWFLVWLLGTAAYHKLRSPGHYLELMMAFVPGLRGGKLLVGLVVSAELCLVVLLLVPATRETGLFGSALLLLAYAGLIAVRLARGNSNIRCGCAGLTSELNISKALVLRNIVCAMLAMIGLSVPVTVPSGLSAAGLSVYVAAFLVTLYLCSDQLAGNAQQMAGEV